MRGRGRIAPEFQFQKFEAQKNLIEFAFNCERESIAGEKGASFV